MVTMVAAAAAVLVSDVLTVEVAVGNPITLISVGVDTSAMGGTDYPDLPDSAVLTNVYDLGVRVQSTDALDSTVVILVTVHAPEGVTAADVGLQWWNGLSWEQVALTDGTDGLTGIVAPPEGFVIGLGYDETEYLLFSFDVPGLYSVDFQAST